MEVGLVAGYQELTGVPSDWPALEAIVRRLPLLPSLVFLAKLDCVSELGHSAMAQSQTIVLLSALGRANPARVAGLLSQGRWFFYHQQILAAMNLVLAWSDPSRNDQTVRDLDDAIEVLARVTDHITAAGTRPADPDAAKSFWLRHWTPSHDEPVPARLARWRYMLTAGVKARPSFDLEGIFSDVTGLSPETYFDGGVLLYLGFMGAVHASQKSRVHPIVTPSWFHHAVPAVRVLADVSVALGGLRAEVQGFSADHERLLFRTRHFQAHPVVQLSDDEYMCLSLRLLGARISSGAHYALIDGIRDKVTKKAYMTYLGSLFECYVADLCDSVGPWDVVPEPEEATADVHVVDAGKALVIECKTKRVIADVLETGDLTGFRRDLSGVREGAEQLADRLGRIRAEQYPVVLPAGGVSPLVCSLEAIPGVHMLADEVDQCFRGHEWIGASTPPTVLSTFDVEMLVAYREVSDAAVHEFEVWLPNRANGTLADHLRGLEWVPWLGTFQRRQWDEAQAAATRLVHVADEKRSANPAPATPEHEA